MKSSADKFLERIFNHNSSRWWENLNAETPKGGKYGLNARYLETTLGQELSDCPDYRSGDRKLYFFSESGRSSIDGRFETIGVEEKYNPLDLKEHLIDGAIHRGVVWVLGNPHNLKPPVEAVSLYVVQAGSVPMSSIAMDLYLPVLYAICKLGIHVVFVDEKTGWNWKITGNGIQNPIPKWLGSKEYPSVWDRKIDLITEGNEAALDVVSDPDKVKKAALVQCRLPGFGQAGDFTEVVINDSCKAAIIDYGNQWRLIELGLLLRSAGYAAVKAIYNKQKHKNKKDRTKNLSVAGRGVEKRIANEMRMRFAVELDWCCKI